MIEDRIDFEFEEAKEQIVLKFGADIKECAGPEFNDHFYKHEDLIKTGDEQKEFLNKIYEQGFDDAFQVLSLDIDTLVEN